MCVCVYIFFFRFFPFRYKTYVSFVLWSNASRGYFSTWYCYYFLYTVHTLLVFLQIESTQNENIRNETKLNSWCLGKTKMEDKYQEKKTRVHWISIVSVFGFCLPIEWNCVWERSVVVGFFSFPFIRFVLYKWNMNVTHAIGKCRAVADVCVFFPLLFPHCLLFEYKIFYTE